MSEPDGTRPPSSRVPALDGARGVAVVLVMLLHVSELHIFGGPSPLDPGGWFSGGFIGVDVFFVLSGLLITSILVREHRAAGRLDLVRFWRARVLRLMPALLLFLAVFAVYSVLAGYPGTGAPSAVTSSVVAAITFTINWKGVISPATRARTRSHVQYVGSERRKRSPGGRSCEDSRQVEHPQPVDRAPSGRRPTRLYQRAFARNHRSHRVNHPSLRMRAPLTGGTNDRCAAVAFGQRREPTMEVNPATVSTPVATDPRVGCVGTSDQFTIDAHRSKSDGRCRSIRHAHLRQTRIATSASGESSSSRPGLCEIDRSDVTDRPRRRQDRIEPIDLDGLVGRPAAKFRDQRRAIRVHRPMRRTGWQGDGTGADRPAVASSPQPQLASVRSRRTQKVAHRSPTSHSSIHPSR